jgi:hypothetical protein
LMARAYLFPKRFLPKRFLGIIRNMETQEELLEKHRPKGDLQGDLKEQSPKHKVGDGGRAHWS